MKKKILFIFIFVLSIFLLVGCGNPHKDEPQYQIYELAQESGYTGTYEEWLETIKGVKGEDGRPIELTIKDKNIVWRYVGDTNWILLTSIDELIGPQGPKGEDGIPGENGKSAYELYKEKYPEYKGTEEEWLDDLVNDRLGNTETKTYTVKFETGYDFKIPNQTHKQFERIIKPTDPVRPGYIFDGWYINDEKVMFTHYFIVEDVTLTAKWTLDEWSIGVENDLDKILLIGDKIKLNYKVMPEGVNQEVTIESNNNEVIEVKDGTLIAKKEGFSYINIRSKENKNCFVDFYVEVLDPNNLPYEIHLEQGNQLRINKMYFLEIKTNEYVYVDKWSVNNALATIDESGTLKTLKAGNIIVSALLNNGITLTKEFTIVESTYPNLQGYNIKIAQAEHAIGNFDPFNETYTQTDKLAKQEAWREVEKDFNCKITVDPYPSVAEWGPARWNYIINQAQAGVSDYDFLTIPDTKIHDFVKKGALIPLTDYYNKYATNIINPIFVESSTYKNNVYGLTQETNNIYNVMYYNIPLFEELQRMDSTLVEPAKLFNDGKWTYDTFVKYCKQVQTVMESKFGYAGKAGDQGQEYFAVSGWDAFWFIGLSCTDGEPIANTKTLDININSPHREEAANVVKELYNKGYASKKQATNQNVQEWNSGKAFFNTGDLWFVGDDGGWRKNLWGDDTRYGYVPWPMPNDMTLDNYKVALSGTAQWVMPIGRDYSNFGPDCTTENIYYAIVEMFKRTAKYHDLMDPDHKVNDLNYQARKYAHSEESQKAYKTIMKKIEDGQGYFDIASINDNPLYSYYIGDFKTVITNYCVKNIYPTWADATKDLVVTMKDNLLKAFG